MARLAVVRPCRWHSSILVGFGANSTMDKRSHPHVSVCALLMIFVLVILAATRKLARMRPFILMLQHVFLRTTYHEEF